MKTNQRFLLLSVLVFAVQYAMPAQVPEDALRFTSFGLGSGTRSLGIGNAYIGVADDYTASIWNPAGLGQLRRLEFTGGLSNSAYDDNATFFQAQRSGSNTSTDLNDLGFVFPFPTSRGSLVFAFGYNRVTDFNSARSFSGYNPNSSIVPSLYDADVNYDIPYQTRLEDYSGFTPIKGNVQQSGDVRGGGGIGTWTFSGAIEVDRDIFFGMSINVISGKYTYVRNYLEADTKNHYTAAAGDTSLYDQFNTFYYDTNLSSDLTGVNVQFGMLYRLGDIARFGLTAKSPSSVTVRETYTNSGQSYFDNGQTYSYSYTASNDYGVSGPWTFGAGFSVMPFDGLLLAADVEYADWSQLQWTDNPDLEKGNLKLSEMFRGTADLHAGVEYELPFYPIRLRAGCMLLPSRFKGDPSSYDNSIITGGLGVLLQDDIMLDVAGAFGSAKDYHNNYSIPLVIDPSRTDESIATTGITATITYRF